MKFDIVRAWKDATYRQSLSAEEQAQLPASPAGEFELSESELAAIHGAQGGANNTYALLCVQSVLLMCNTAGVDCANSGGNSNGSGS